MELLKPLPGKHRWPALLVWALGWLAMFALDGRVDLANLSMLLVMSAALASLWQPVPASMLSSLLAVMAFNWCFVPPRGSFAVDLRSHALLLGSMLLLSWISSILLARLRWQALVAQRHAAQAEALRRLADRLRDAAQPAEQAPLLVEALQPLSAGPVQLLCLLDQLPARNDDAAALLLGAPDADAHDGLWACLRAGQAFGPGTGRYEELPAWYLPMRGRQASHGAVRIALPGTVDTGQREQAQALSDLMGQALERRVAERSTQRAHDEAEGQATRNALLAAISHDYRTPLATILGAASALQEQGDKLSAAQRRRLVETVMDETRSLSRFTDNTLQLARLDAPGVQLKLDWESAEELVGAVLRRVRQRRALEAEDGPKLRARLEPELPLLRCDALLLTQLLENLVDNALKYAGSSGIEILVRRERVEHPQGRPASGPPPEGAKETWGGPAFPCDQLVLAVRDRGPGVPPAWRQRIFEVFQRGQELDRQRPDAAPARGAGVGLAACRAIARAHGGEMRYRARSHGGSSFECWLPVAEQPT
ncbi:ATP-binding protein [Pelomonas sp. SE-A7]|uniref:sensor histidine kinase n=1 Tax=Pelomonas sp. SE-A7 TaxID=3054953 RepID=UPI00259CDB68|nr:ATP-binding protein [Pelomonas sp. SE-A7]MDM4767110.1 ATP-binding protein [Pelomonas sp. SE-A7]